MKHKQSPRQTRFNEVLEQFRGRLGRIALTYAREDADDLLQEILLQIWKSLPWFEERSTIGTWCYRIAINTAITWKRKHERKRIEQPLGNMDPATNPDNTDAEGLLPRFLASLNDADQALLVMHLDNVDHKDIASALGVSLGAVRTRMSRLRQKLAAWDCPGEVTTSKRSETSKEVNDG